MATVSEEPHQILQQRIRTSLERARQYRTRLTRAATRYSIGHIILSALATSVAGVATVSGTPLMGDWRWTCAIAAVAAFGATIVAGLQMILANPDRLGEASECVARLTALEVETITVSYDLEAVRDKYQQILADCTRIDAA